MAGRPRTTLKRINHWEEHVQSLVDDINRHIPKDYLETETDLTKYKKKYDRNNRELEKLCAHLKCDVPVSYGELENFDMVAYQWAIVRKGAEELLELMQDLGITIRQREDKKRDFQDETRVSMSEASDLGEVG